MVCGRCPVRGQVPTARTMPATSKRIAPIRIVFFLPRPVDGCGPEKLIIRTLDVVQKSWRVANIHGAGGSKPLRVRILILKHLLPRLSTLCRFLETWCRRAFRFAGER